MKTFKNCDHLKTPENTKDRSQQGNGPICRICYNEREKHWRRAKVAQLRGEVYDPENYVKSSRWRNQNASN